MKKFSILSLVIIALSILGSVIAQAHPSDGQVPNEAPAGYGTDRFGLRPELSIGDYTFVELPDRAALTDKERYIVGGTQNSAYGHPLQPWWNDVMVIVESYWLKTGELPTQFDGEVLYTVFGEDADLAKWSSILTSPLDNQLPRLDSASFSAGDMYVKIVDEQSKHWIAEHEPSSNRIYEDLWFHSRESYIEGGQIAYREKHLTTPVFYVRVYGESGVILNTLFFGVEP